MNTHYAVVGNPVLHSLSPKIHQRAFDYYQLNARYFAYEVADFADFMKYFKGQKKGYTPYSYLISDKEKMHGSALQAMQYGEKLTPYLQSDFTFPMQGLSITIPHKQSVLDFADSVTYRAKLSGASNTLYWENEKLVADNTDIAGFYVPLAEKISEGALYKSAVIYGAGGAGRAVLVALLHCQTMETIYLCVRREEQARDCIADIKAREKEIVEHGLNDKVQIKYLPLAHDEFACDLVVNTIPQWGDTAISPRKDFSNVQLAYDLTYKNTPFLEEAKKQGIATQDGKRMFIEQAKEQFRLWTGKIIPEICYKDI